MFFLHFVSAVVDTWMHHSVFFFNCRKCNLYNIPSTLVSNYECYFSPCHPTHPISTKKKNWVGGCSGMVLYQCTSILLTHSVVTLTFVFFDGSISQEYALRQNIVAISRLNSFASLSVLWNKHIPALKVTQPFFSLFLCQLQQKMLQQKGATLLENERVDAAVLDLVQSQPNLFVFSHKKKIWRLI